MCFCVSRPNIRVQNCTCVGLPIPKGAMCFLVRYIFGPILPREFEICLGGFNARFLIAPEIVEESDKIDPSFHSHRCYK